MIPETTVSVDERKEAIWQNVDYRKCHFCPRKFIAEPFDGRKYCDECSKVGIGILDAFVDTKLPEAASLPAKRFFDVVRTLIASP